VLCRVMSSCVDLSWVVSSCVELCKSCVPVVYVLCMTGVSVVFE